MASDNTNGHSFISLHVGLITFIKCACKLAEKNYFNMPAKFASAFDTIGLLKVCVRKI